MQNQKWVDRIQGSSHMGGSLIWTCGISWSGQVNRTFVKILNDKSVNKYNLITMENGEKIWFMSFIYYLIIKIFTHYDTRGVYLNKKN